MIVAGGLTDGTSRGRLARKLVQVGHARAQLLQRKCSRSSSSSPGKAHNVVRWEEDALVLAAAADGDERIFEFMSRPSVGRCGLTSDCRCASMMSSACRHFGRELGSMSLPSRLGGAEFRRDTRLRHSLISVESLRSSRLGIS